MNVNTWLEKRALNADSIGLNNSDGGFLGFDKSDGSSNIYKITDEDKRGPKKDLRKPEEILFDTLYADKKKLAIL